HTPPPVALPHVDPALGAGWTHGKVQAGLLAVGESVAGRLALGVMARLGAHDLERGEMVGLRHICRLPNALCQLLCKLGRGLCGTARKRKSPILVDICGLS